MTLDFSTICSILLAIMSLVLGAYILGTRQRSREVRDELKLRKEIQLAKLLSKQADNDRLPVVTPAAKQQQKRLENNRRLPKSQK